MQIVNRRQGSLNKKLPRGHIFLVDELKSVHSFSDIMSLSWTQFEQFCGLLVREHMPIGHIKLTREIDDFMGIDLWGEIKKKRVAMQCKHWSINGPDPARRQIGFNDLIKFIRDIAKQNYKFDRGIRYGIFVATVPCILTEEERILLDHHETLCGINLQIIDKDGINAGMKRIRRNYNSYDE